ncbi:MAG: HAMP domain-containing sensor histidine kinase [Nitriliruptorales bacterium]|nr:HAMP domain-containing sensor histidine kinase [Nitriliruptorales bacterium]
MSLRVRLTLALIGLLAVGVTVYGVSTYRAFEEAERDRFDRELRAALDLVVRDLRGPAGFAGISPPGDVAGEPPPLPADRPVVVAPGTYGALFEGGELVDVTYVGDADVEPDLTGIDPTAAGMYTVGSVASDTDWRVYVQQGPGDSSALAASPLTSLSESLDRLLVIGTMAGVALVAVLGAGAWIVLGRGLRPLERMAATAGSIREGSLDQRVDPSSPNTEVGQLAKALNGMLDDLEAAFREREATEARLRRFLADASHELRTPLTSIQGFAEMFRLGADSEHVDQATAVRRIEQEAKRMRVLVDDLLLLARLDEERPVEQARVDLAVLAADACSDAVALDPDRPVRLDAPEPVPVVGNQAHLRQAIGNLVANALRHTPDGTVIKVQARRAGSDAVVAVRDHGPGFPEEALARAFDRFWQADPARAGEGSGLGLSIVAAIAREHGGSVTAANHQDGGAVVSLTIPAVDSRREALPRGRRHRWCQRGSRRL